VTRTVAQQECLEAVPSDVLAKVVRLGRRLAEAGVRYCHWKSTQRLGTALRGGTDLDLLVWRADVMRFESVLHELGFRATTGPAWDAHPWLRHFYALDEGTGSIVHLHVSSRLITGGGLVKNYRFPLESLLLDTLPGAGVMPVPRRDVELLVFVLRKAVEQGSLAEWSMLLREGRRVQDELGWLLQGTTEGEACGLLARWLPPVSASRFQAALRALLAGGPSSRGFYLAARRLRSDLRPYRLRGRVVVSLLAAARVTRLAARRALHRWSTQVPASGGCLFAFVGSDGAGKSTVIASSAAWLERELDVRVVHTGTPPSTALSVVPKAFLPLLRRLFPQDRMLYLARENFTRIGVPKPPSVIALIRSVLIAHDQRALLRRALRHASRGAIVLCDRYPSVRRGGMDGARADAAAIPAGQWLKRALARREHLIYASMPRPDHVFFLEVPLELALRRNAERTRAQGQDDETSVRERYQLVLHWDIPDVPVTRLDTTRGLEHTVQTVRAIIWGAL
jgi:thymidylate kinase